MDNYVLGPDEALLFETEYYNDVRVALTNLNFIHFKKFKKFLSREQVVVAVFPKEELKVYKGVPQIKRKGKIIELYFTSGDAEVEFSSVSLAQKFERIFVNLVTDKSRAIRAAEKVRSAIDVVDTALGIYTVEAVKDVIGIGISAKIGGISAKTVKSAKTTAAAAAAKKFSKRK